MASTIIGRGIFFVRDVILLNPEGEISKIFQDWFQYALKAKNLTDWVTYLLKIGSNKLISEEVFKIDTT